MDKYKLDIIKELYALKRELTLNKIFFVNYYFKRNVGKYEIQNYISFRTNDDLYYLEQMMICIKVY